MQASVTLSNSDLRKNLITRNLSRVLDIRILDIDLENRILHLRYNNQKALDQVKNELLRIGYQISKYSYEEPHIDTHTANTSEWMFV